MYSVVVPYSQSAPETSRYDAPTRNLLKLDAEYGIDWIS